MRALKIMKLFVPLLLIGAFAASSSAQVSLPGTVSTNLSPVQMSAQAIITSLEAPINCPPAETTCFAQVLDVRLTAATEGLKSLIRLDTENQAINELKDRHIATQDKIIVKYEKLDSNNQKVDTNSLRIDELGRQNTALYEKTINDLHGDLASCKSTQKFIAIGAGLGGGVVGYKFAKKTSNSNGLLSFTQNSEPGSQFIMFQTNSDQRLREALKKLNQR